MEPGFGHSAGPTLLDQPQRAKSSKSSSGFFDSWVWHATGFDSNEQQQPLIANVTSNGLGLIGVLMHSSQNHYTVHVFSELYGDYSYPLTQNSYLRKIILNTYFCKITNLIRDSLKKSSFPEDFEGTKSPQNYEK